MTQTEPARSGPAVAGCPVHNFNYTENKPAGTRHARYDAFREESPIFRNEFGPGFYTVANYEGILAVMQDAETFSNSVVTPLDPNPPFQVDSGDARRQRAPAMA